MMLFRRSTVLAIATAAGVAVAVPAAAIGGSEGRATASAVTLSAFGQEALDLAIGASDAAVGPTEATAGATALSLLGEGARVTLGSGSDRDPEEGDGCQTPTSPLDGLDLGLGCTVAAAYAGAPSASGTATLGGLSVDGSLVPALLDTILGPIEEALVPQVDAAVSDAYDSLTGPVLGPVVAQLQPACSDALAALEPITEQVTPVLDTIANGLPSELAGPIEVVTDAVAGNAEVVLPEACAVLFDLVSSPPQLQDVLDFVQQQLRLLLDGRALLSLTIGDSTSTVGPAGSAFAADAAASTVTLTLPSLSDLTLDVQDLPENLVRGLVDLVAGEVEGLEGIVVPTLEDVLAALPLEGLPLDVPALLSSEDPLLVLTVLPGTASVSQPTAGGDATRTADAAVVRATVAEALGAVFGQEELEVSVSPGDSVTLFADTPLESTLASGATEEFDETSGSVTLAGIRTAAADLALFTGLEGGIELTAGAAEAAAGVGSSVAPAPEPDEDDLPVTGGGAALLALGLLGAGGALARRRS
jgi:hypothetical protein